MPIYEYRCASCGTEFETLVYGQAAVICPACESAEVTRRLSVFGFKAGGSFVGSSAGCACGAGGCGCH